MQKSDSFSLCADARSLVDELDARGPAASQHVVEVVDSKADVMDSWSALRHEARDRRVRIVGLQQLHQRLPRAESGYVRAIRIVERNLGQSQHIAKERKGPVKGLDCDPNVRYARATRG